MNLKEIKEMINLMNENDLLELEVEKDDMRIRLKKTTPHAEGYNAPTIVEKQRISEAPALGEPSEIQEKNQNKTLEIKAPMVGTFYRAPSPESAPFVEIGQVIEPGQVICIIEAMKLMNEIKSEVKGRIIDIHVESAEPVEFGQVLFVVEMAG